MFFEIQRDQFLDGLSKTVPIAEKRSPLPILSHVLMHAEDSQLVFTATDLEVGLRMTYEAQVTTPGGLAAPAKKIFEIVRELPQKTVTVDATEGTRMKILCGKSVFELAAMDPQDYPAWPTFDRSVASVVQAERLLYMVDKTMFASSSDDSRFNLNGVLFEQSEQTIRLVATDGHRLALIDESLGISLESRVLVPRKGLQELRRILENVKGEISLGFDQKNLFIFGDRFTMTVRLIEGDYPEYRKVIPEASDSISKASRTGLLQLLKRVAVLTSDRNKGITVRLVPGTLEMTAVHPDLGTAHDEIDVEYDGEERVVIINAAYLMEALAAIDSDEVLFEFSKEKSPIIIRPDPPKNYFNLVMPMRR